MISCGEVVPADGPNDALWKKVVFWGYGCRADGNQICAAFALRVALPARLFESFPSTSEHRNMAPDGEICAQA